MHNDLRSSHEISLREHLADRDVPCPACSYNLRDAASATCPECGFELRIRSGRLICPNTGGSFVEAIATLMGVFLVLAGIAITLALFLHWSDPPPFPVIFVALIIATAPAVFATRWIRNAQWLRRLMADRSSLLSMFLRMFIILLFVIVISIGLVGVIRNAL